QRKVEPKVVVGQEEALDTAALDLVHDLVDGAETHASAADADRSAEVTVARAAARDLQVGRPVVFVLIDHLDDTVSDGGEPFQVSPTQIFVDWLEPLPALGGK